MEPLNPTVATLQKTDDCHAHFKFVQYKSSSPMWVTFASLCTDLMDAHKQNQ